MIWRVGDGSQINIWLDPWLPRGTTRRPVTPRGRTVLTRVADLIDPATGSWDRELIGDNFWEEDVQQILAIPIKQGMEDSIAWHFDPRGRFSVKSSYHVLVDNRDQQKVRQEGSSSRSEPEEGLVVQWKKLWKLPCIPKVKQFMWRLAHDSHYV
jgi:hypothetical protein